MGFKKFLRFPRKLFLTFHAFDNAAKFYNSIVKADMWSSYDIYCEATCRYLELHPDKREDIFALNLPALKVIGTATPWTNQFLMSTLKYIVPTSDGLPPPLVARSRSFKLIKSLTMPVHSAAQTAGESAHGEEPLIDHVHSQRLNELHSAGYAPQVSVLEFALHRILEFAFEEVI